MPTQEVVVLGRYTAQDGSTVLFTPNKLYFQSPEGLWSEMILENIPPDQHSFMGLSVGGDLHLWYLSFEYLTPSDSQQQDTIYRPNYLQLPESFLTDASASQLTICQRTLSKMLAERHSTDPIGLAILAVLHASGPARYRAIGEPNPLVITISVQS